MSELKPCPFCGNKPDMWYTERIGLWTIHCFNEDAHRAGAAAKTEAEAIEAWNTRYERTCEGRRCEWSDEWLCSECGGSLAGCMFKPEVDGFVQIPNFCPNCGAKVVE